MELRGLGRSGLQVRPVGLGCAAIGGSYSRDGRPNGRGPIDPTEVIRAVHYAIDHEVTLFDVGNIYGAGDAERLLGRALATSGQGATAVVQAKFGASFDEVTRRQIDYQDRFEVAWVRSSLEGTLRRLGREQVEIFQFQIHDYDLAWQAEILATLDELVEEGKIRSYGIGTGDLERAAMFIAGAHCAGVIHSHNVLQPAPEMVARCAEGGVASLAGMPYFLGSLVRPGFAAETYPSDDVRSTVYSGQRLAPLLRRAEGLHPLLAANGRTLVAGALGWIWAQGDNTIPIPGFRTMAQVESVVDALGHGPLAGPDLRAIDGHLGR